MSSGASPLPSPSPTPSPSDGQGEAEHVTDILSDSDKASWGYVDKIASFDWNKDGFIRMYRVMGALEADYVRRTKELGTLEDRQEVWLSTSIKHSRQFENKAVADHSGDVCMAFKVNMNKFSEKFKDDQIIPQYNSKAVNEDADLAQLKNLVNREKLKRHLWEKFNFCLKGKENVDKFNQCIEAVDELAIKKFEKRGKIRRKIVKVGPNNEEETVRSSESRQRVEEKEKVRAEEERKRQENNDKKGKDFLEKVKETKGKNKKGKVNIGALLACCNRDKRERDEDDD